ncbi:MAG: menaquinone biosynthesis protein [Planctomycetota bacterium]
MEPGVGRIDFINTAPVYLGIDTGHVICPGHTVAAPPSTLNRLLREGKIQISSISSVAYAQAFPDWLILPGLSISANGPVKSVLLCSREPFEGCPMGMHPRVGLSDKSDTSKALVRILLEDRFHTQPVYEEADLSNGVPKGLDGLLVIGDDALTLDYATHYPFTLDLGRFWVEWTGLPFVFGLWAVDRGYAARHPRETADVVEALLRSKEMGIRDLYTAARRASKRAGVSEEMCRDYLQHIEYDLDSLHLQGLNRFYAFLKKRGEIKEEVEPLFWEPESGEESHGA